MQPSFVPSQRKIKQISTNKSSFLGGSLQTVLWKQNTYILDSDQNILWVEGNCTVISWHIRVSCHDAVQCRLKSLIIIYMTEIKAGDALVSLRCKWNDRWSFHHSLRLERADLRGVRFEHQQGCRSRGPLLGNGWAAPACPEDCGCLVHARKHGARCNPSFSWLGRKS